MGADGDCSRDWGTCDGSRPVFRELCPVKRTTDSRSLTLRCAQVRDDRTGVECARGAVAMAKASHGRRWRVGRGRARWGAQDDTP
jgi:hypothetical protein